jgi:hypothetical protein
MPHHGRAQDTAKSGAFSTRRHGLVNSATKDYIPATRAP